MKAGKAFELFVKRILLSVGFTEVASDGLYIFDGAPSQMIQGLGEAHNADVLLEPPVQTPFYAQTRLLIECKDYSKKIGLNTVRSILGLREDINHFDIVDIKELITRRRQSRYGLVYNYPRYSYQVAIAAINGYTVQAQKFAATYRIPLLEFGAMPFWNKFYSSYLNPPKLHANIPDDGEISREIIELADDIGKRMAIAITNSGQMLFLYRNTGNQNQFTDTYSLHWNTPELPWELKTAEQTYLFQLPNKIMRFWLDNAKNEIETRKSALDCKAQFLSNMIVYYTEYNRPTIKMISIDKFKLEQARKNMSSKFRNQ